MDDLRTSIKQMLRASLAAAASVEDVLLLDSALDFSSERATSHIFANRTTARARFDDAVAAVRSAPQFVSRVKRFLPSERVLSQSDFKSYIDVRTYDCFYPWCKPQ